MVARGQLLVLILLRLHSFFVSSYNNFLGAIGLVVLAWLV